MTGLLLIVLLMVAVAVMLHDNPQPPANQARKVLRSFYVVQHDLPEARQQAYLLEELERLSLLKKGRRYTLRELVALLEATAEVTPRQELERYGLKNLPDSIVHSRVQRWHRATRLPAWAVWSGYDPEAPDVAIRFRELAQQHLVPTTAQRN